MARRLTPRELEEIREDLYIPLPRPARPASLKTRCLRALQTALVRVASLFL